MEKNNFTDGVIRQSDEYWLCECGAVTLSAEQLEEHCEENMHIAEKVDTETGEVIGFHAGTRFKKYSEGIPDTAMVDRKRKKNEPMFERK